MMRRLREAAPVVAGLVALAGALGAAYVAHEASSVQAEINRSDAAFRVERAPRDLWQVDSPLEGVLGVKDDLAFRKAANFYDLTKRRGSGTSPSPYAVGANSLRAAAQLELGQAEREGLSGVALSRAENLDAVITTQAA